MARTRAQDKAAKKEDESAPPHTKVPKKRQEPEEESKESDEPPAKAPKKDKKPKNSKPKHEEQAKDDSKAKQATKGNPRGQMKHSAKGSDKIQKLLSTYGTLPLQDTALSDPTSPTPETIFAHLLNATLSSTRISHELAAKTVRTVIEAGYADLDTLEKSSWQERTEVLTEGGYTHYREKTATQLGELAELLGEEYDGDLNNLLKQAKGSAGSDSSKVIEEVRQKVKKIKGIGNVAVDVFCDTVQGVWPELAPFIDPRSRKTAEGIGLPTDVQELYEAVGKDPVEMCKLASALTVVRLDKKEGEFT